MAEPSRPANRVDRTARIIASLERKADRPWFLPTVAAFPLADFLLPFLPNQLLLAALSLLHPARWTHFALLFAGATGLATLLVAIAIQTFGLPLVEGLLGGLPDGSAAADVRDAIAHHGMAALFALSLFPSTPRTAVIVCALAGLPPPALAAAVASGRLAPTTMIALAGARAPGLLRRNARMAALLVAVERLRSAPDQV